MQNKNILDLIITSQPDLVSVTEIYDASTFNISTDHQIIIFKIYSKSDLGTKVKKGNFSGLKTAGEAISIEKLFVDNVSDEAYDINNGWTIWKDLLFSSSSVTISIG